MSNYLIFSWLGMMFFGITLLIFDTTRSIEDFTWIGLLGGIVLLVSIISMCFVFSSNWKDEIIK